MQDEVGGEHGGHGDDEQQQQRIESTMMLSFFRLISPGNRK
jgi:hypothetical protein